jgi:hypothetical protein
MADAAPAPQDDVQAWSQQYDQQQAAQKSQELLPKQEAPHPSGAVRDWISSLPSRIDSPALDTAMQVVGSLYKETGDAARDVAVGVTKGAVNTAKAIDLVAGGADQPHTAIWDHAMSAAQDFTDAIKVKDPSIQDGMVQYAAQVAPSYLLASRMLGSLHGVANAVTAGAAADASALDPHAPRFADILGVLKQTDGKIGQALKAAGPYGLNAYINYLGSDKNETEAQGRFKNALDGLLPNFIGTELLHAAGVTVKQGYRGLRYMVDNGVGSGSELATMAAQRGGPAADPAEAIATQQAREDMVAAAKNPNGKRPPLRPGADPADPIYEAEIKRHTENASGESAASQEAINRHASEQEAGVSRWRIDPDGNRLPLVGVDAVDAAAPKGHVHTIRDAEGNEIITDRGGLTQAQAKGLIARSKLRGE